MHYGFSVLFVVTFSSPHFIPLIDIGVEIEAKREKMAEKQQKIFLTLDFDNSYLSNQGYFVFCCFFCSPPLVGHCPKARAASSQPTVCYVENIVLFRWK